MTRPPGSPGYERRDALVRPMVLAGFALLALTAGGLLVGLAFLPSELSREEPLHPMTPFRSRPAGPQLEASPGEELKALRAWEDERLQSYGWIDRTDRVVHIPLERALRLTLEELGEEGK